MTKSSCVATVSPPDLELVGKRKKKGFFLPAAKPSGHRMVRVVVVVVGGGL